MATWESLTIDEWAGLSVEGWSTLVVDVTQNPLYSDEAIWDADSILRYLGQVQKPVYDGFGSVTSVTTIATASCFVYQRDHLLETKGTEYTYPDTYLVLFPLALRGVLAVNDRVLHVRNRSGREVLASGVITELYPYFHWRDNLQLYAAEVGLT